MHVFVVIGRLPQAPAGYVLLGVRKTEEQAEALKAEREKNPNIVGGFRYTAIDIWDDIIWPKKSLINFF